MSAPHRRSIRSISGNERRLFFETLEDRRVMAADVQLVQDFNPLQQQSYYTSNPRSMTEFKGATYFTAFTRENGRELWKTDGTDAGTVLVKDINIPSSGFNSNGLASSELLTNVHGTLYFVAQSQASAPYSSLWKSDGTAAGTVPVFQNSTGPRLDDFKEQFADVNGILFFSGRDPVTNVVGLWKSDGTEAGTILLKDGFEVLGSEDWGTTQTFANMNGELYFSAGEFTNIALNPHDDHSTATVTAYSLWKSDGTPAGTQKLANVGATWLTPVNNTLFFQGNGELWKTDGTTAGTVQVKDIAPGAFQGNGIGYPYSSQPSYLTNLNGLLVFTAKSIQPTLSGELGFSDLPTMWKSDGTEAGTLPIENYDLQISKGIDKPAKLVKNNGAVFFSTSNALWRTDGNSLTQILKTEVQRTPVKPLGLASVEGTIFFNDNLSNLWKSDGTTNGTVVLASGVIPELTANTQPPSFEYKNNPAYLTNSNKSLYFLGTGNSLWKSNGTTAGTVQLKNNYSNTSDSYPTLIKTENGSLIYRAYSPTGNFWKTDGLPQGTVPDALRNQFGYLQQELTIGGITYFSGQKTNDPIGSALWKSDGTVAGTTLFQGTTGATATIQAPYNLVNVNGTLFFTATSPTAGKELWKTDGTPAGTVVFDLDPLNSSYPDELTNVNGQLYFRARNATGGDDLWTSDGTAAGTVRLTNSNGSLYPNQFTIVNDKLYFLSAINGLGKLWSSNGTTAGTSVVDSQLTIDSALTNVNGTLYFSGYRYVDDNGDLDVIGDELWKYDGTTATAVLVKEIYPGSVTRGGGYIDAFYSRPTALQNINGILYFFANDGIHGRELWKSDGTEAGTVLVKDIYEGSYSSSSAGGIAQPFVQHKGLTYFAATESTGGTEIWQTDGTFNGTKQVIDLVPGTGNSDPKSLVSYGDYLYFSAYTLETGKELWRYLPGAFNPTTLSKTPAGNIELRDGGNFKDAFTLSRSGANLVITNNMPNPSDGYISINGIPSATGNGTNSVSIPLTTIQATGKPLLINTGLGDDVVKFDTKSLYANGPIPSTSISIDLGTGKDLVQLVNTVTNNVWTITSPQSGTVKVGSLGTITFNGVENIKGGTGKDTFTITNTSANQIANIDGGGGGDSVAVTRDMNATLTDITLHMQPLNGQPIQLFYLANIKQGTLTGGAGNNFFDANTFTGNVILNGGDGNDTLWGGTGNDILRGGNGNDFVGGGPGDDFMTGDAGRDLLIGGAGSDRLNSAVHKGSDYGDDLLIGGRTTYGFQRVFVEAILAAWTTPISYISRIELLSKTGVGTNKQFKINSTTVLDDNAIDTFYAGGGLDWLLVGTSGLYKDTHDAVTGEQVVGV